MKTCVKCGSIFCGIRCNECKRAHAKRFRLANKEKLKLRSATWLENNKEKRKAYASDYYAKNKEKIRAQNAAWKAKNPDRYSEAIAQWARDNPEKLRLYKHNRRERSKGDKLSPGISSKLIKLQRGKCACCGLPLGDDYHLDHIMPLALGGTNTDDNIQLLRAACNLQKNKKHPVDFMQSKGLLL